MADDLPTAIANLADAIAAMETLTEAAIAIRGQLSDSAGALDAAKDAAVDATAQALAAAGAGTAILAARDQVIASSGYNWFYAGSAANVPIVTDLLGNILEVTGGGYIYSSRDPADPVNAQIFAAQFHTAGLDNVWTYGGTSAAIVTDLLGNILSYSANGIIYTIPDPNIPSVAAQLAAAGLGNLWTCSSDALITDIVGNILASSNSLKAPAGAIHRSAPILLKANEILATGRAWTGQIVNGQSLSVGEHAHGVVSAAQPFANLTFLGGPSSTKEGSSNTAFMNPGLSGSMALVETLGRAEGNVDNSGGETQASGMANYAVERALRKGLITDPTQYINFAFNPGHTSYSIRQLSDPAWFQLFTDQVDAFVALAQAAGVTCSITTMGWIQGNADIDQGTTFQGYINALVAYRNKCEAYIQSKIPDNGPLAVLMNQTEYSIATNNAIALAQTWLAKNQLHFYMIAPTFYFPHFSNESHLVKEGYKWDGCLFGRAKQQLEIEQISPDWLELLSATFYNGEVKYRFRVPVLPIRIDEAVCGPTIQSGLAVKDSTGLIALSNIRVSDAGDEIIATCAATPQAGATARIALDYAGLGVHIGSSRSTNVRDSSDETCLIGDVKYPLWNVATADEVPIIFLKG